MHVLTNRKPNDRRKTNERKTADCRAIAALCLTDILSGASLKRQLPIDEQHVANKDRALLRELCYGTLRAYPHLQGIASHLLSKPLKNKDQDIMMLLLLGGYQLTHMRVPDYAAIAATVNAAQALGKPWAKGLINALLRRWQQQDTQLAKRLTQAQAAAHPAWLYNALQNHWGHHLSGIIMANNEHPPMCLRVNRLHHTVDDYVHLLATHNIASHRAAFAANGLYLQQPKPVDQLPGFTKGWCSVQDEAAQLAAQLLLLAPQQRVLDACCAPGGKTGLLLEHEPELAELVALDQDAERLASVANNLHRLKLNATLVCADVIDTDSWWDGKPFDRILLDAPCSATGVIRRNPDIKVHRQPQDIVQLCQLQQQLLTALWPTLKPNGLLLYVTCSVLPEENEQQIARFCTQHADAKSLTIQAPWGISHTYGRQLLPQQQGHDGFYYALIRKQGTCHQ